LQPSGPPLPEATNAVAPRRRLRPRLRRPRRPA